VEKTPGAFFNRGKIERGTTTSRGRCTVVSLLILCRWLIKHISLLYYTKSRKKGNKRIPGRGHIGGGRSQTAIRAKKRKDANQNFLKSLETLELAIIGKFFVSCEKKQEKGPDIQSGNSRNGPAKRKKNPWKNAGEEFQAGVTDVPRFSDKAKMGRGGKKILGLSCKAAENQGRRFWLKKGREARSHSPVNRDIGKFGGHLKRRSRVGAPYPTNFLRISLKKPNKRTIGKESKREKTSSRGEEQEVKKRAEKGLETDEAAPQSSHDRQRTKRIVLVSPAYHGAASGDQKERNKRRIERSGK